MVGESKTSKASVINSNRASTSLQRHVWFQPQKPWLRPQSQKSHGLDHNLKDQNLLHPSLKIHMYSNILLQLELSSHHLQLLLLQTLTLQPRREVGDLLQIQMRKRERRDLKAK